MKNLVLFLFITFSFCCSCNKPKDSIPYNPPPSQSQGGPEKKAEDSLNIPTKVFTVKVVKKLEHDVGAFTQGLIYYKGSLFESTGQNGSSSLRKLAPATGNVLKKIPIAAMFFSEGISIINDKIFMLTWLNGVCMTFRVDDFKQLGSFNYEGEGWGLTNDGSSLIMSDGTNILRYINPDNFNIEKTIYVNDHGTPVVALNELEMIDGYIWANIWNDDKIAVIEPETGNVAAWIDARPLRSYVEGNTKIDVINGIAYDKDTKSIYLTGKFWPWLFIIEYIKVD